MQTRSKFIVPKIEKIKCMASTEKIAITSSDPDHVVLIPLSYYFKKLDVKSQRALSKEDSTIGTDPVSIDVKRFEPDCLPPVESTDLLFHLVLETSAIIRKNNLKPSIVSRSSINLCRLCLQRSTTYHRKQVRGVGKSAALGADERCLDSNLDYYREGWDNELRSLFGM